jgi:hypothetical protein
MIRNPFFPRLSWAIRSHEAGSFPSYRIQHLRGTFASLLVSAGVPLFHVA